MKEHEKKRRRKKKAHQPTTVAEQTHMMNIFLFIYYFHIAGRINCIILASYIAHYVKHSISVFVLNNCNFMLTKLSDTKI